MSVCVRVGVCVCEREREAIRGSNYVAVPLVRNR